MNEQSVRTEFMGAWMGSYRGQFINDLRRVKNDRDRRRVYIYLTEQGPALGDTLVPRAIALNEGALSGLTAAERDQAKTLMRRMIASLEYSRSVQKEGSHAPQHEGIG